LNSFKVILNGLYKYLRIKKYKDLSELVGIAQRY